jgi:hypothetical protein
MCGNGDRWRWCQDGGDACSAAVLSLEELGGLGWLVLAVVPEATLVRPSTSESNVSASLSTYIESMVKPSPTEEHQSIKPEQTIQAQGSLMAVT